MTPTSGRGHTPQDDTPTAGVTRIDLHPDPNELDAVAISEQVDRSMRSAAEVMANSVPRESVRASERTSWRIGTFAVIIAVVVSLGMGTAAVFLARSAADAVASERVDRKAAEGRNADVQAATSAAIEQLKASNAQLAARGQAPVPEPPPDPSGSDALVAATTAKVLAALPKQPTSAEIGQMIAATVAAQPTGPSAAELSAAVADYLQRNPPPPGPAGETGAKGDKGDKGDPPSQADIEAAVDAWFAAHPEAVGQDGADGKPPAGWTQPGPLPGQTLTCTRDGDSPDSAPTYTCA